MSSRRQVPLVYMTLGTSTNTDVYRSVLDALEDLYVDVLVTIGSGRDPATIGPMPGNAHVEQ